MGNSTRFRRSLAVAVSVTALISATTLPAAASTQRAALTQRTALTQRVSTCKTAGLRYAFGARHDDQGQVTRAVNLTNKGSSACTLTGFPGVDLVGVAHGKQNYTWPLVRQSAKYSRVTLAPGRTAHFNLVYLIGVPGDGMNITVHKIVITPPNDYAHADLSWSQPVLLQDAATYPGTYVGPVIAGPAWRLWG